MESGKPFEYKKKILKMGEFNDDEEGEDEADGELMTQIYSGEKNLK